MQTKQPTPITRLFFCHIPKTGGITLRTLLSDHFRQRDIFPYGQLEEVPHDISPDELLGYCLYQGHFLWSSMLSLLGKPLPTITMLRNPLDRVLSVYDHIRSNPAHPRHQRINGINATLEDFLDNKWLYADYANAQVLFLSGTPKASSTVAAEREYKFSLARYPQHLNLERAKEALEQIDLLGITERFDDSMHLLCNRFGWTPRVTYEHLNVGHERKRADDFPKALLDRIADVNRLDIELYEYGKTLFEARYRQLVADLLWDSYNYRAQSHSRPPEVFISFDEAIEGYGWYPREFTSSGRCFRWSGPGNCSTLFTGVAPAEKMVVRVGVMHAIAEEMLTNLQININGIPLSLNRTFDHEQQMIVIDAVTDGKLFDSGVSAIEFCLPRTLSPNDLNSANEDRRKLGIALYWVKITPYH